MTEPLKDLEHKVEETVEGLAHEAEEGESVAIVVAVVVAILLVLAFTAYYLTN